MVEADVGGGSGTAWSPEEGGGRSSDQDIDGAECESSDLLPFEERLLDLATSPYAQRLLEDATAVLPLPVRSGDVTPETQEAVDQYIAEEDDNPRIRGRVVLRSPSVPEPGESPEDPHGPQDPHGPLSPQEFFGLHQRLMAVVEAAAERTSMATPAATFGLRDGDLLRPLPEGIATAQNRASKSRLLMDWLGRGAFLNRVEFEGGYPDPESLAPGSPDIEEMRRFLSRQDHRNIPGDLADAVFLERDYRLEPITDLPKLRPGQTVVVVVNSNARSLLVDRSLKPTKNPFKWFVRMMKFGNDSLSPPMPYYPHRHSLPLGTISGQPPGDITVVTASLQSLEQSAQSCTAHLNPSRYTSPDSLRSLSVEKLPTLHPSLSFEYVDPHLRKELFPPTYKYKIVGTGEEFNPGFRLYGLVKKQKDAKEMDRL